ncbi:MAG: rRNA pseudouridine synthase [Oscillospiraceae bacterium]|nr:rRNA pseudouridine synthase [Oscillospiraceae bacterium]
MKLQRLDQFLAARGYGSRKETTALVKAGLVQVNGVREQRSDRKIDIETDCVAVRGERVKMEEFVYYMLHKPRGVISASRDPKMLTALDLLPKELRRPGLFPAGRLDKDSTGLLLVTNDGALAHALLSPRRHVEKRYHVTLAASAEDADVAAFAAGMRLPPADGHPPEDCAPAELRVLQGKQAEVVLREGKYHQIRRMFAARGNEVLALHRFAFGALYLEESLVAGACRPLTADEMEAMKAAYDATT